MRKLLVGIVAIVLGVPAGAAKADPHPQQASADGYLQKVVQLSPAPEYRRFGTAAAAAVANYGADQLAKAGFSVVRQDVDGLTRWAIDYTDANKPQLTRVSDGRQFKADSA